MAYYFHWGRAEILGLDRQESRRWLREIRVIAEAQREYRARESLEQAQAVRALIRSERDGQ